MKPLVEPTFFKITHIRELDETRLVSADIKPFYYLTMTLIKIVEQETLQHKTP